MMIRFDENTGLMQFTETGRIASHLYITHETIELYNEKLHETMEDSQILGLISECHEFQNLNLRDDEVKELEDMENRVWHRLGPQFLRCGPWKTVSGAEYPGEVGHCGRAGVRAGVVSFCDP